MSTEASADRLPVVLPEPALWVAGARMAPAETAPVLNPWTNEPIARVALAQPHDAERACAAATAAFEASRRMPRHARHALLHAIASGLREHRHALAQLIALEAGKPLPLALVEVERATQTFSLAAEEATRIGGEVVPMDVTMRTESYYGHVERVPKGPVLAITPFNFPLNLVAHKVAPAIACGCPVVLKPAPQTPLTALRLAEIVREAGAPPSLLQVLPCTTPVAESLVRSEAFATLSFTGSDRVGWFLKSIAGKKRVLLELGGNAACIVDEGPRDLGELSARITSSAFGYAGQVCIKTQRLYAHVSVIEPLVAELSSRARALLPSDPLSGASILGPMIDDAAARRIEAWVREACDAGAASVVLGAREGNRVGPTVLRFQDEGRGLAIVDEEAFGPVLTVHSFEHFDEALAMAGATRFGLQAGVFTDSLSRARRAFERLEVGALIVNDVPTMRIDAMPYGGVRDSGAGREGVRYAIDAFTEPKLFVVRS